MIIRYEGESLSAAEWTRRIGLPPHAIRDRVHRRGMTPLSALVDAVAVLRGLKVFARENNLPRPPPDISGLRVGDLTVLGRCASSRLGWECRCACGSVTNVRRHLLTSGAARKCGRCLPSRWTQSVVCYGARMSVQELADMLGVSRSSVQRRLSRGDTIESVILRAIPRVAGSRSSRNRNRDATTSASPVASANVRPSRKVTRSS